MSEVRPDRRRAGLVVAERKSTEIAEPGDQLSPSESEGLTGRSRTKRHLRLVVAFVVLGLAAAALSLSATVLASLSQSANTEAVFNDAAELPEELFDAVIWAPDPADLPRQMEPLTRVDVTNSWLRAWEQLRIVAETGETTGVEVYFSHSARSGVLAAASSWEGRSVRQVGHDLQLTFYSEDGQVIGLTATESRLVRSEELNGREWTQETVESFEALLVLEDGNWRIHHLVRRSVEAGPWIESTPQE